MTVYLDLVILLDFAVDFLLLMGANRLCGFSSKLWRVATAAGLGGVYAGVCMLHEFRFLGNTLWRLVTLGTMAVIAYGWNRSTIRRGILFVFLSMALGGIALGLGNGGFWSLVASAGGVCLLSLIGFRGKANGAEYVAVKMTHAGKTRCLTALRDTGNTLTDPLTGESVLVVGAETAWDMLSLSEAELKTPVQTMQEHPVSGLRLIPYRAVGQPSGMLLGIRMDEVIIGKEISSGLVAFAPQNLGKKEAYQALVGGL